MIECFENSKQIMDHENKDEISQREDEITCKNIESIARLAKMAFISHFIIENTCHTCISYKTILNLLKKYQSLWFSFLSLIKSRYLASASKPKLLNFLSLSKRMHVDVLLDINELVISTHCFKCDAVGSLLKSLLVEKANPEYVVPKSIADTRR